MKYAHVKNGTVVATYSSPPESFENISNFPAMPQGERARRGFYRLVENEAPTAWHAIVSTQYAIDAAAGEVTATHAFQSTAPESVTARQIRLWLVSHGIGLAAVDAAIDAIPDVQQREAVRVEWEYAPYVERSHPMLVPLAAALGMDSAAVDQAFREAAAI